jgi:hypothetical protein
MENRARRGHETHPSIHRAKECRISSPIPGRFPLCQWFSNLSVYESHLQGQFEQVLDPTPRFLDSEICISSELLEKTDAAAVEPSLLEPTLYQVFTNLLCVESLSFLSCEMGITTLLSSRGCGKGRWVPAP